MNKSIPQAIVIWVLPLLVSCGLIFDIPDNPGVSCFPAAENQVLSEQQLPHICFDFPVDKNSVEALFSVNDTGGALQGHFHWDEQTVYFQAQPALVPGRRYVLSFAGTFNDAQGVEYSVCHLVPFFFKQRHEAAPFVLTSEPDTGDTIACNEAIRIVFSEAIEPESAIRGLSIEPDTAFHASWENGQTELVLRPQDDWKHCHCLTIEVNEELRDTGGVPLAEPRRLIFWIQEDIESPVIASVQPVFDLPAELYPPTGYGIGEAVGLRDGIGIAFNEAMECDDTAQALTVHPAVATIRVWLNPFTLVIVPVNGFAPGCEYRLVFDEGATDLAGNPLSMVEALRFSTVQGLIRVDTELVNDGIRLDQWEYSTTTAIEIHPYPITSAADYIVVFSFTGAVFAGNCEKSAVHDAISLRCLFPASGVADPAATGFSWTGDRVLSITFSNLQLSSSNRRVYYLLRIRGGPGGIATEGGYRLETDLEQLFVTAPLVEEEGG